MSQVFVVGLNFKSAPIEVRERLAFPQETWPRLYPQVQKSCGADELILLSTCNRVEVYGSNEDPIGAAERVYDYLIDYSRLDKSIVSPALYCRHQPDSIRHLFEVAGGLDSMVVGESEILCQIKCAYQYAHTRGATGKFLNVLFQRALNAGKAVRSDTGLGRACGSVGSVAVDLAQKVFGSLKGKRVLLVGAGEIAQSTLKRISIRGADNLAMINRSPERAEWLAQQFGGIYYLWHHLEEKVAQADIVICSTAATNSILTQNQVKSAMEVRHNRPLYLIDLGVPRNVDPSVDSLDNVYLFNIDDLQRIADRNLREQNKAVKAAKAVLSRKVDHYLDWWKQETSACAPSSWERAVVS